MPNKNPKPNKSFVTPSSSSLDRSVKLQTISRVMNREKDPAIRMAMMEEYKKTLFEKKKNDGR